MSALTAQHHGTRARVTHHDGDAREGVLTLACNPSYPRRYVRHWWLVIPSALPHFTHDALSLQWSGSAVVTLLEGQTDAQ